MAETETQKLIRLANLGKFSADYEASQLARLVAKSRAAGVSPKTVLAQAIAEGYLYKKSISQGKKGWSMGMSFKGFSPDWTAMFDPGFLTHLSKEGVISLSKNPYSFSWKEDPWNNLREVLGKEKEFFTSAWFPTNIHERNWMGLDPEILAIHRIKFLGEKFKKQPEVIRHQAWQGLGKIGVTERRAEKRWFGKLKPGTSMMKHPEHGRRVMELIKQLGENPEIERLINQ